jgi:hypothetical protein
MKGRIAAALLVGILLALGACDRKSGERAGGKLGEAGEHMGEAVEKVGEAVSEAAK